LLPAGAAVAGWVIFLPLEERVLFTAHSDFGFRVLGIFVDAMVLVRLPEDGTYRPKRGTKEPK
jgi:hypothetical protein